MASEMGHYKNAVALTSFTHISAFLGASKEHLFQTGRGAFITDLAHLFSHVQKVSHNLISQ